jgi:SAM-dependent methyltransferase
MMERLRAWARDAVETLDDPGADPAAVRASLRDLERVNRLFGGTAAALSRLQEFFGDERAPRRMSLLDVGAGAGDMARAAVRRAAQTGVALAAFALERRRLIARTSRSGGDLVALVADGALLPLRDRSVDLVLCAKVLHHLRVEMSVKVLAELNRVARVGVVVADLHRSALAAAGIWLASWPLRLHPATRRDGVISVLRGFTRKELARRCDAAGITASIRRHPGYYLTAAWTPGAVRRQPSAGPRDRAGLAAAVSGHRSEEA